MTLNEMDTYFRSFLNFDAYASDPSKNGIQVQNKHPNSKQISKVAFAVDACLETIKKSIENGADVLIVHHGLFWGYEQTITSNHYQRLRLLIENDIALYACHIPLDANEEVGNNYGLARKIGLTNLSPFGSWKGMKIGVQGCFESPHSLSTISELLLDDNQKMLGLLPFGKKEIMSVAIVSGGAEDLLSEAIENNIDAYITGELSHETFHLAKESNISVLAGGHYNTETMGVCLLAKKLHTEHAMETVFLDVSTGL